MYDNEDSVLYAMLNILAFLNLNLIVWKEWFYLLLMPCCFVSV